ncbi:MAG TPA: hypothetical protein VGS19_28460 [Streptosporangiaceae bacterium]|nr:hypothetical protein [Streptosporangiaceae bacterium]
METNNAADVAQELERLRARVRADRRDTSMPMLVFGGLVTFFAAAGLAAGRLPASGRHVTLLLFWPVFTIVALQVLWRISRRRALREGVGESRPSYRTMLAGYLAGLLLVTVVFTPVLFAGVFVPMVWPAAVLTAIALWQRNRALGVLAVGVGVAGVLETYYVVVHRGVPQDWLWLQSVVYAVVGLGLLSAGLAVRHRERAAS